MIILILILSGFLGFALGRLGHIYGGQINGPHHWIYGLILIIIGVILYKTDLGKMLMAFGLGVFVSDFKDFLAFRIYGVDDVVIKKFWQID